MSFNFWELHHSDFVFRYAKDFYWTKPNFLNEHQTADLLQYAKNQEGRGAFQPAAVGKGLNKKRLSEIRSDQIFWIDDFNSKTGEMLNSIFEGLRQIARLDFYLPARRFECHLTKYERGSHYKLHQDRHIDKPGRLITCVIYLSSCPENSGNLILLDEDLKPVTIKPEPGRIVVFDSSLEHAVTQCKGERWSLTGWIRDDLHPGLRF